jgi:hypothetical protein
VLRLLLQQCRDLFVAAFTFEVFESAFLTAAFFLAAGF